MNFGPKVGQCVPNPMIGFKDRVIKKPLEKNLAIHKMITEVKCRPFLGFK